MAQGRAARADLREAGQGAGPEERPQGAAQAGQGRRLGRDRDRLRPRGRADRPRGAGGDPRRQPEAAQRLRRRRAAGRQARALLGAHQGGDRGGVHQPGRALRAARARRRGAPGHRPDLGRDADALRLARDRAGSARSSCRSAACRAPRSRSSSSASWSGARTWRSPTGRCSPSSSTPTARSPPTTRWTSSGRRQRRRPRSRARPARASSSRSSRSATRATRRRRSTRPPSRAPLRPSASRRRARCGSPRTSTWTGSSPIRAPTTPSTRSRCRCASCCARSRRCRAFKEAAPLAEREKLEPTRGKKETTDHPPIYPTQALDPSVLPDDGHRKIYELVVRRFLATFADPAVSESTRADIEAGNQTYFVRGNVLVEPGFLAVYPYSRSKDEEIPKVEEGQELPLAAAPCAPPGADDEGRTATEPVGRREGDPAAVAHRAGQADRDDGGAAASARRRRATTSSRSSTTAATSRATRSSRARRASRW